MPGRLVTQDATENCSTYQSLLKDIGSTFFALKGVNVNFAWFMLACVGLASLKLEGVNTQCFNSHHL